VKTLYLVRHGHTVWHATGGVAGRTDIALSERGRQAVKALRASLPAVFAVASTGENLPPAWCCSPVQRTVETASLLCGDAPLASDPRLVELDFGDWEGSTWEAVHRDHGAQLAAWGENWVSGAPPNGESFAQQLARCALWLDEAQGERGDVRVAVAHGGTIRALLSLLLGHAPQQAMRFRIDPAHVCRLDRRGEGWTLRASNLARFV